MDLTCKSMKIMTESIKKLVEDIDKKEKDILKDSEKLIKNSFKEFFNKNPEAAFISWTQYSPYFNDGDACTFGVYDPELHLVPSYNEMLSEAEPYFDESDVYSCGENCAQTILGNTKDKRLKEIFKDYLNLTEVFCLEKGFEEAFGNHVIVVASKEGFDISSHDHD